MSLLLLALVVICALLSYGLLLLLVPLLRIKLLDQPNFRSSHSLPTPSAGGLVFVVVSCLVSSYGLIAGSHSPINLLPLLALPLAWVGWLDDKNDLPPTWRFFVQLLTAFLLLGASPLCQILFTWGPVSFLLRLFLSVVLIIAIAAVINFTNFMDGVDGLVAGCMLVAITALFISSEAPWPVWSLVGALVGFLFWNWSPAKVFMGDVGSTFLGAVFGGLVLQARDWPQAFAYLLVASPLMGDAFFCVLRRCLAGHKVFQAHRLHLFQRLHQAGWSHSRVSLLYIAATLLLGVCMILGGLQLTFGIAVVLLLVGCWLDQRVAVPFAIASKS